MITDISSTQIVVARLDDEGHPAFVDTNIKALHKIEGAVDSAYIWEVKGLPLLPREIGSTPNDMSFPSPGDVKVGLVCFPAHSAGSLDMHDNPGADNLLAGPSRGMHMSASVDVEIIISGKVDIVLENGARRTLTPGTVIVMGGVMHAWENIYDEDCYYAMTVIGATASGSD